MSPVRDISDKGKGENPRSKKLRYEVCIFCKTDDPDEVPEVVARTRWHGMAVKAVEGLRVDTVFTEILIRNA